MDNYYEVPGSSGDYPHMHAHSGNLPLPPVHSVAILVGHVL